MKVLNTLFLVFIVVGSYAQSNDSLAVVSTTEKYIQAFYQSNPDWLEEVLHPELIKRTTKSYGDSQEFIITNGKIVMVELSKIFNSKGQYNNLSSAEIEVLDITGNMATVKLLAEKWVDYLHLVKLNNEWKIVNVIWTMI
ncbi:nuclear transport factor 2 family protein [Parvicella tangerina]|uniref:Nuclear transport factor 2 family protein n=1 Tax=Parvicella tangerina TaxID=2829795 RepID=A0A916JN39_9FLAO|nr:nuclear transport factor 2 family protein [Parvicella tangerina]CAG5083024.1 hypothetical protein CRYO30217_02070 [Parvicella tangerina]